MWAGFLGAAAAIAVALGGCADVDRAFDTETPGGVASERRTVDLQNPGWGIAVWDAQARPGSSLCLAVSASGVQVGHGSFLIHGQKKLDSWAPTNVGGWGGAWSYPLGSTGDAWIHAAGTEFRYSGSDPPAIMVDRAQYRAEGCVTPYRSMQNESSMVALFFATDIEAAGISARFSYAGTAPRFMATGGLETMSVMRAHDFMADTRVSVGTVHLARALSNAVPASSAADSLWAFLPPHNHVDPRLAPDNGPTYASGVVFPSGTEEKTDSAGLAFVVPDDAGLLRFWSDGDVRLMHGNPPVLVGWPLAPVEP